MVGGTPRKTKCQRFEGLKTANANSHTQHWHSWLYKRNTYTLTLEQPRCAFLLATSVTCQWRRCPLLRLVMLTKYWQIDYSLTTTQKHKHKYTRIKNIFVNSHVVPHQMLNVLTTGSRLLASAASHLVWLCEIWPVYIHYGVLPPPCGRQGGCTTSTNCCC